MLWSRVFIFNLSCVCGGGFKTQFTVQKKNPTALPYPHTSLKNADLQSLAKPKDES